MWLGYAMIVDPSGDELELTEGFYPPETTVQVYCDNNTLQLTDDVYTCVSFYNDTTQIETYDWDLPTLPQCQGERSG